MPSDLPLPKSLRHPQEAERLAALSRYDVIDTPVEEAFNDIVRLASQICQVPVSLITLVEEDRQWFKAAYGVDITETPRDISFCAHAILGGDHLMEVQDAAQDPRFQQNPLVTGDHHVRFYSGAVLHTEDGLPLGTLCVLDTKPGQLDEHQRFALKTLADQVMTQLELRRNLKEQKRISAAVEEARLAAESANIAKSEFLANMSHEIRTPMNAVIGLSNILALSQPLSPKQRNYIQTLQMSADSLLALINDLLDIAKIEARTVELEYVPFSVTQIMHEVISMMSVRVQEKGLRLTGSGAGVEDRLFLGDPTRLRQIILNLCSNAIKFTEQGDVNINITCHPTERDNIETIVIAVKDTGIGIAADKLEPIFEKFVQADSSINRKYGGTGLGLAITKTLVDVMGGKLEVESTVGEGSNFIISLQLERAQQEAVLKSSQVPATMLEKSEPAENTFCILLVEDYAPNVLVATTFIESFGYRCDVATNGTEAIEKAKWGDYLAAIMDVQMHGMNGFEATMLIRENERKTGRPPLPVIGMTAHALAGDRERCLSAGMNYYIAKPFNPDELEQMLGRIHGLKKAA